MKPVFVFDGKPPEMKSKELAKRKEGRDAADADLATAKEVCACSHALRAPSRAYSSRRWERQGP
jgi:5'-3' exonuclease